MAETATIAHETAKLFPDVPLSRYDVSGTYWQKGAGKPLTMAEKRAIFGDAYMVPSNVTNLKPLRHEPTIRVIASTSVDGKTSEHVAIGARDATPAPVTQEAPAIERAAAIVNAVRAAQGNPIHAVVRPKSSHAGTAAANTAPANTAPAQRADDAPAIAGIIGHGGVIVPGVTRAEAAAVPTKDDGTVDVFACDGDQFATVIKAAAAVFAPVSSDESRLTVHAAASVAARVCPSCGTPAEPTDKFCAECGARLSHDATAHETPRHEPATIACAACGAIGAIGEAFCGQCGVPYYSADPAQEQADAIFDAIPADVIRAMRGKYSPKNCARIFTQCPDATDVRGFHAWLKAGRAVQKGQKGIKILAPVTRKQDSGETVVNVKPAYVFDISQTAPIAPRAGKEDAPRSYAAAD